ncbi:hypothetical protein E1B28_013345 [Marasmius oreades]|uniref:Uncharacterized protein n=1 Tax=Marasmius oreades TaxID=181124 RepID=A0A9P7RPE9_9AGAR|nr:uncharacterized protein E1B28_013345 [Marasmius oreades]KAG7087371.1 hypothetical protein E1B28_013345 [Marasmius oreades]
MALAITWLVVSLRLSKASNEPPEMSMFDVRVTRMGDIERRAIQRRANWKLWSSRKKPHQVKAFIQFPTGQIKIDAVVVPPHEYRIYTAHKMIVEIRGINVATPALLAVIKLQSIAIRGNICKVSQDVRDLIWALEKVKEKGEGPDSMIPQDALEAGFTAG